MKYLIDGHNLIGKMPDIKLSDPDDEKKLVTRLQSWAALDSKRKIQVYFDSGQFGGFGDLLSGGGVKVQFARIGQEADDLIIREVAKIKNPQEFTVITSDNKILWVAKQKRVGYILSEEFVEWMLTEIAATLKDEPKEKPTPDEAEQVFMKAQEVDEWIRLFEEAPKREIERPNVDLPDTIIKDKPIATSAKLESDPLPPAKPEMFKEGAAALNKDELQEWLSVFPQPEKKPTRQEIKQAAKPKKKGKVKQKKVRDTGPDPKSKLSAEDLKAWQAYFGDDT